MTVGYSWGRGAGWSKIIELIEVARLADATEWDAERRDRIYQQVLVRAEKERKRRRRLRGFAAGASALLLVGFVLKLAVAL